LISTTVQRKKKKKISRAENVANSRRGHFKLSRTTGFKGGIKIIRWSRWGGNEPMCQEPVKNGHNPEKKGIRAWKPSNPQSEKDIGWGERTVPGSKWKKI